ncbi:hypothetical protein N7517_008163 [Penicillium concentricum]|uniref:F-box domain-containing protein n=1 Tax=Penicillium concentricum TaxID=293559 RepID=A0A9W9V1E7_9EURO|nr:uncharacterized protein N7517_008163 [Penicillium concentricum]KAJ5365277.1 hypothetical protein N7517_008163 [Penicillium concentricum]
MLETLPCEILMLIADWLPPAHLRALSRVSSRVYSVLVPHIYRTITFHAASEWALNVLDVDSFFLHLGQSRSVGYLQHVRNLQIQAPFHLVRFNRCAYYNIFRAAGLPESPTILGASDEATAHQQFLDDVKDQLQLIFTHLKPNSLSTFEWRLGTYVPMGVLDQGGYLSRYQQRLARLSLITDDLLLHEPGDGRSLSSVIRFLRSFRGLQHLHLRLSNFPTSESRIQDAIKHHQTTFKSLVYHKRQLAPIGEDGLFEDDRDVSPVWIANLSTIVDLGQVTALALCVRPSAARRCLRPTAKHSQLRLLHLRFSGPERIHRDVQREIITFLHETRKPYSQDPRSRRGLVDEDISSNNNDYDRILNAYYDRSPLECMDFQEAVLESSAAIAEAEDFVSFAEWAFGPGGLPALQVLAFGDFSHGDRYRGQQFLMRRAYPVWDSDGKGLAGLTCDDTTRLPFRPADMADPSIWDGVSVDGARFLSACPGGGLMESPYEP